MVQPVGIVVSRRSRPIGLLFATSHPARAVSHHCTGSLNRHINHILVISHHPHQIALFIPLLVATFINSNLTLI